MNPKPLRVALRGAGFTLLEVLLTLVILSIGLLGLAAMQVLGLKSNNAASYRSQAVLVAADMVERIRSNPTAVNASRFLNVTSADAAADCGNLPQFCGSFLDASSGTPTVADGVECDPAALANYDINIMYCGDPRNKDDADDRALTGLRALPQGRMTITCTVADCPQAEHVVTVSWNEQVRNADGTATAETRNLNLNFVP